MLDTNSILAAAFSLISQFNSQVPIPEHESVSSIREIRTLRIGSSTSPVDVYMVSDKGTTFRITRGIVQRFATADSMSGAWEPIRLEMDSVSVLSSNDVAKVAIEVLRKLNKSSG
jgi:hypothetical protein